MYVKSGLILYLLIPLFECQLIFFQISKVFVRNFHSFSSTENFHLFFFTIPICESVKRGVAFYLLIYFNLFVNLLLGSRSKSILEVYSQ